MAAWGYRLTADHRLRHLWLRLALLPVLMIVAAAALALIAPLALLNFHFFIHQYTGRTIFNCSFCFWKKFTTFNTITNVFSCF